MHFATHLRTWYVACLSASWHTSKLLYRCVMLWWQRHIQCNMGGTSFCQMEVWWVKSWHQEYMEHFSPHPILVFMCGVWTSYTKYFFSSSGHGPAVFRVWTSPSSEFLLLFGELSLAVSTVWSGAHHDTQLFRLVLYMLAHSSCDSWLHWFTFRKFC
jgi:hypothetical protein